MKQIDFIKEIDTLMEHLHTVKTKAEKSYRYNQALDMQSKMDILKVLRKRIEPPEVEE